MIMLVTIGIKTEDHPRQHKTQMKSHQTTTQDSTKHNTNHTKPKHTIAQNTNQITPNTNA